MGPVVRFAAVFALAGAGLVSAIAQAAPSVAPPIADFAADTDFSFPALSPDGKKLAFVTRVQDARLVVVLDFEKKERRALMPCF